MLAALIAAASLAASGSVSPASDQCPVLPASAVTAATAKLTTSYQSGDFAFRRERGFSRCSLEGENRRCVIDDPGVMEARLSADVTYFNVPVGRKAVLTVEGGKLSCSLAD